jgi:hypothetical protein
VGWFEGLKSGTAGVLCWDLGELDGGGCSGPLKVVWIKDRVFKGGNDKIRCNGKEYHNQEATILRLQATSSTGVTAKSTGVTAKKNVCRSVT